MANYVVQQHSPVGLFANAHLCDSGQAVRILPSSGTTQLVNILEALAKVVLIPTSSFAEFLQGEQSHLPWGATLVLVISRSPKSLPELLADLRKEGHKPVVLQIGKHQSGGIDHKVTWYNVRHPGDLEKLGARGVK